VTSPVANEPDLLVVGANPAIDVYYCLDRLRAGEVNRVTSVRAAAGGKANNLARAYRRLGGTPLVTAIAGGETGRRILADLTEEGIAHDYAAIEGESRQTVTVVAGGETTVFLEPGPPVTREVLDALAAKVARWAPVVSAVAITGSVPPGAPTDSIARMVDAARAASTALVAVDAAGEVLRLAAIAGPGLIKVNADEFESAFGCCARDRTALEGIYRDLAERGLDTLCVTDGPRGALVLSRSDRLAVRTESTGQVSTAGAGDAFFAGLLFALRCGDSIREATRLASAAAAAAVQTVGAGFIDRAVVDTALTRTDIVDADAFFAESGS
jgi:tagatose 6-phosphate kinase